MGLQWNATGVLLRNYLSDQKCDVKVGCNGMQREHCQGVIPLTKIAIKEWADNGLQRAASGGFREVNLLRNCDIRVGCKSMKYEDFEELPGP